MDKLSFYECQFVPIYNSDFYTLPLNFIKQNLMMYFFSGHKMCYRHINRTPSLAKDCDQVHRFGSYIAIKGSRLIIFKYAKCAFRLLISDAQIKIVRKPNKGNKYKFKEHWWSKIRKMLCQKRPRLSMPGIRKSLIFRIIYTFSNSNL